MKKLRFYFIISISIIILDQLIKYAAFVYRYDFPIVIFGDWFKLNYVLNSGMAFGAEFGGSYGKLFLTLFRVVAVFFIISYLKKLYHANSSKTLLVCISMILGGAVGNTIDSLFYGLLDSKYLLVSDAPFKLCYGKVIDMFHFDLFTVHIPEWFPIMSDVYYPLWPVFNVADAAIFVAVIIILVFQKAIFNKKPIY
ncbi:MAG: signal peptidase II [Cyclobacteriaceae bacterium]